MRGGCAHRAVKLVHETETRMKQLTHVVEHEVQAVVMGTCAA